MGYVEIIRDGFTLRLEDDYAVIPAIREAAMILAVQIWQARQTQQTGSVGMDGIGAA